MRRGTNLTPIYFFSSVRTGSGKSTIVTNLSVFLNDLNFKVAVIDFDKAQPLKLKSTYPQSVALQEYQDISNFINSEGARFQKNFYFTETNLISYFPAHNLSSISELSTDTAFRDYFAQLTNNFEAVIVNLPAGTQEIKQVSELLTKQYLWRGCKPHSAIVSLSEEGSLIELDRFIQSNQQIVYQAEENTYFVFNRVPSSPNEQSVNDTVLNISEVRSIFTYPLTYVIPFIDEFLEQKMRPEACVLQSDSPINQHIAGIYRLFKGGCPISYIIQEKNNYQSCITGSLLRKINPYFGKLQKRTAAKLFVNPSNLQIFLEHSEQNYRIRIRLTAASQQIKGIRTDIPNYKDLKLAISNNDESFKIHSFKKNLKAIDPVDRPINYTLSFKSIFSFDDCFYAAPVSKIKENIPIVPTKEACPSPLVMTPDYSIPEIPTLSNILGLSRKRNKSFDLIEKNWLMTEPAVEPVYSPNEFSLNYNKDTFIQGIVTPTCKDYPTFRAIRCLPDEIEIPKTYSHIEPIIPLFRIRGYYDRNHELKLQRDFVTKNDLPSYISDGVSILPHGSFTFLSEVALNKPEIFHFAATKINHKENINIESFKIQFFGPNADILGRTCRFDDRKKVIASPTGFLHSKSSPSTLGYWSKPEKYKFFPGSNKIVNQFVIAKDVSFARLSIPEILIEPKPKATNKFAYLYDKMARLIPYGLPIFKKLPKRISLEPLLLDYHYGENEVLDSKDYSNLLESIISAGSEFIPEIKILFNHAYEEPDYNIKYEPYLFKRESFYHIFKSIESAMKSVEVKDNQVTKNSNHKYKDIFASYTRLERFADYVLKLGAPTNWIGTKGRYPDIDKPISLQIPPLKLIGVKHLEARNPNTVKNIYFLDSFISTGLENRLALRSKSLEKVELKKNKFNFEFIPCKTFAVPQFVNKHIEHEDNKFITRELYLGINNYLYSLTTQTIRISALKFELFEGKDISKELVIENNGIKSETNITIETSTFVPRIKFRDIRGVPPASLPLRRNLIKLTYPITDIRKKSPQQLYFASMLGFKCITDCGETERGEFSHPSPRKLGYSMPETVSSYSLPEFMADEPEAIVPFCDFKVMPENPIDLIYEQYLKHLSEGFEIDEHFNNSIKKVNKAFDSECNNLQYALAREYDFSYGDKTRNKISYTRNRVTFPVGISPINNLVEMTSSANNSVNKVSASL